MMRLRLIVRSALCCLLCLTVCAAPVLAAEYKYGDGFFYWGEGASILYDIVGTGNNAGQTASCDVLQGYFPATFESVNDLYKDNSQHYLVLGSALPSLPSFNYRVNIPARMYVEVLFSVPAPVTFTRTAPSGASTTVYGYWGLGESGMRDLSFWGGSEAFIAYSQIIDGEELDYVEGVQGAPAPGDYEVKRYWGYRFYVDPNVKGYFGNSDGTPLCFKIHWNDTNTYVWSDPNYPAGIYDEVQINTGILQEINGTLTDIKTSTVQIQSDVSEIKGGLQDSNSSIWGAFKESVSGLFVPSSGELESVKDDFDRLAREKLGGAYQAVDIVSEGVKVVNNKFKNPGSSPGVEFPGISVPLGGDVGTVTLAGSQTVTIPEKITNVLYPVSGTIIPIVCTIWTVRLGLDMVHCFMSGMSYGEFLHRHTDEEDNEV